MVSVLAPVTTGVVLALHKTGLKKSYKPFIAMIVGVVIGLLGAPLIVDAEIGQRLWAGFLSGLTAVGLFEAGKQTIKSKED
nr:holin [Geomicrobium sediminis]